MSDRRRRATAVIGLRVRAQDEPVLRDWQRRITAVLVQQDGFQGTEIFSPMSGVQEEHVVFVRFDSLPQLEAWLTSDARARLIEEIDALCVEPPTHQVLTVADEGARTGGRFPVTEVITTSVLEGLEQDYLVWQREMDALVSRAEGFLSTELFAPALGYGTAWTIVIRFETSAHLDAWLSSPARLQMLEQAAPFASGFKLRSVASGFGSWFEGSARAGDFIVMPPRWKQGLTVLLPLFPTVTLITLFVLPRLESLPLPLRVLVGNVVAVLVLTWVAMPAVNRILGRWLRGTLTPRENALTLAGVLLTIAATAWVLSML